MGKKILYIILGAILVFGLLFLLWSWFFSGPAKNPSDTGSLGSAGDTTQTGTGGNNSSNNGQTSLGGNGSDTDTNGTQVINGGQNTNGSVTGANGSGGTDNGTAGGSVGNVQTVGSVPGISWLGSPFNPTDINGVSSGVGGFAPTITSQPGSNSNNSLIGLLAGTAIAGTVSCAIQAGIVALSTTGATANLVVGTKEAATGYALTQAGLVPPASAPGVFVLGSGVINDAVTHAQLAGLGSIQGASYVIQATQNAKSVGKDQITFIGCIVNVVAKTALQQITISVVNWINSGFNGQPSFVTNYQQFFTNVADAAAGQFIQGAGLSFLCSPFQLQIKIAIAQSYANRNAQSCTLTKVIGNVNSFMNGNFAQGGWGGFVSFTTIPTNNPYGAFAYAQAGLANAQANAAANAKNNISPTGFLNLQKLSGCDNPTNNGISGGASLGVNPQAAVAGGAASLPSGCKAQVITPGGAIADSLGAVNKSGIDQLGIGNDLDQIITALTTQLMTKALYGGLSSLSQSTTQTSADLAAQSQALGLLNDMQSRTTLAQQLGAIYQGSIGDIQTVQANVNTLANCWSSVASSTNDASAAQKAADANTTFKSLDDQVTGYNNSITQINAKIATLNQFQSDLSLSSTAADVARVTANYNAAVASGAFVSQADVTTAQQNRTTLQSQLAATNQATQNGLTQCSAAQ